MYRKWTVLLFTLPLLLFLGACSAQESSADATKVEESQTDRDDEGWETMARVPDTDTRTDRTRSVEGTRSNANEDPHRYLGDGPADRNSEYERGMQGRDESHPMDSAGNRHHEEMMEDHATQMHSNRKGRNEAYVKRKAQGFPDSNQRSGEEGFESDAERQEYVKRLESRFEKVDAKLIDAFQKVGALKEVDESRWSAEKAEIENLIASMQEILNDLERTNNSARQSAALRP